MKWILIIPLVFLQFLSYSQDGKDTIISKTDKEIYLLGETIKIHLKSKRAFRLSTTGDCSSSVLSPIYIMEVDGVWKEPEVQRQMCCGLPFSSAMKEKDYEMVIGIIGRYKMAVFTNKGLIISNVFEVINH